MADDDTIRRLEGYGAALASKHLEIAQTAAILRPLLNDEEIYGSLNNSYAAHALEHLRFTLLYSVVQGLCNLCLDKDSRTVSLNVVWKHLKDVDTCKAARENFAQPVELHLAGSFSREMTPEARREFIARRNEKDIADANKRFDEIFEKTKQSVDELLASGLAKRLVTARNKVISHYEMTPIGEEAKLVSISDMGLKWGDHEGFLEETTGPVFDTALLLTRGNYDLEEFYGQHKLYSEDFWYHWKNGWKPGRS